MLDTCTLAVFAEINSSAAISRLLRPAATSRSTSNSRAVSPSWSRGDGPAPDVVPARGSSSWLPRLTLARLLIELDDPGPNTDVEAAWDEEIQARVRAVDAGCAEGIPYEQVLARVNRRLTP